VEGEEGENGGGRRRSRWCKQIVKPKKVVEIAGKPGGERHMGKWRKRWGM